MKRLYSMIIAVCILGTLSGVIYACSQPTEECTEDCEVSITPSVMPEISATPTPGCTLVLRGEFRVCDETPSPSVTEAPNATPTPPTCGESEHLNLQGDKCLRFEMPGAPTSSWTQADYDKNFPGEDKFHGVAK